MRLIADNREIELLREIEEHLREIDKWSGRTWFGTDTEDEFRREIILRKEAIAHALVLLEKHRKSLERITLNHLQLSVRTYNALHAASLTTAADIVRCSELDLVRLPNFGRSMLKEIKKQLAAFDLELREEP